MRPLTRAAVLVLLATANASPIWGRPLATDLGHSGNQRVAAAFEAYRQNSRGCQAQGSQKRVLVTGFGLFQDYKFNISGVIVESMSNPDFFPARIDTTWPTHVPKIEPMPGRLSNSDNGGKAYNRVLNLDGVNYDFCFLLLDAQWDLAAGIAVHEISRFQPHMVLMTGAGGFEAIFESGAINKTDRKAGYSAEGESLGSLNRPRSTWILPDAPANDYQEMNWDTSFLAAAARPLIGAMRYQTSVNSPGNASESYICNNLSYVVLRALRGHPVTLAGDQIKLPAVRGAQAARVGFLHIPAMRMVGEGYTFAGEVSGWSRILAMIARAELTR
jgi:pyrrolidone-carboxylate peptidase